MGRYKTATEVRQEHLDVLGADLGSLVHAVYNECAWLHLKWHQYVELFGTKPERIDLLNQSAGLFFRVVQDCFWDDTLLHLARLTDSPTTARKDNLTIRRLPPLVLDEAVRSELQTLVGKAVAATAFALDWRNRRIAHRDLALATQEGARPLAPASRKQVNEALDAVCAPIQQLHAHYFDSELSFEVIAEPADAVSLLYVLRDGVEAEERRRQRLRDRKIDPEDLKPRGAV